jgi:MarC family membrane protein
MNQDATLFVSTFTTLLAIINPLEHYPVFLRLLQGKDQRAHRLVARRACTYATLLLFFFLIFGSLLLEIFEVPLSMVRIVGGITLMRIGLSLFMPSAAATSPIADSPGGASGDVAFVPLAMPLMFGPGAIATVLGMASLVRHPLAHCSSLNFLSIGGQYGRSWVNSPSAGGDKRIAARSPKPAQRLVPLPVLGLGFSSRHSIRSARAEVINREAATSTKVLSSFCRLGTAASRCRSGTSRITCASRATNTTSGSG